MNTALWIAQVLLALFFAAAGYYHGLMPVAEAAKAAPWIADVPRWLSRFIGVAELAGALGVVLPTATGIRPRLASLAALGLAILMVLAIGFHFSRGESRMIGMHLTAGALAAFVAWGRATR
jgi:putative oxidoreductase